MCLSLNQSPLLCSNCAAFARCEKCFPHCWTKTMFFPNKESLFNSYQQLYGFHFCLCCCCCCRCFCLSCGCRAGNINGVSEFLLNCYCCTFEKMNMLKLFGVIIIENIWSNCRSWWDVKPQQNHVCSVFDYIQYIVI